MLILLENYWRENRWRATLIIIEFSIRVNFQLNLFDFSFYDGLLFLVWADVGLNPLEHLYLILNFRLDGLKLILPCSYFLQEPLFEWLLRATRVSGYHNFLLFKLVLSDKSSQLLGIDCWEAGTFVEIFDDLDLLIEIWKLWVFFIFHTVCAARSLLYFLQANRILDGINIHCGILFI